MQDHSTRKDIAVKTNTAQKEPSNSGNKSGFLLLIIRLILGIFLGIFFVTLSYAQITYQLVCGFELSGAKVAWGRNNPDGLTTMGTNICYWSAATSARSGTYAARFHSTTTNDISNLFTRVNFDSLNFPAGTPAFYTAWLRIPSVATVPLANEFLVAFETIPTGKDIELYWTTADRISLGRQGSIQGTTSSAPPRDVWFPVQMRAGNATLSNRDTLKVLGNVFTDTLVWSANPIKRMYAGMGSNDGSIQGSGPYVDVDDIVITGGGFIDTSEQVLADFVASDSARAGWNGGAGGTTNLNKALLNVPPVGTNGTENDTTNISNTTSNATDNYFATCTSYSGLGISSGRTINCVVAFVRHGEHAATGSEDGAVRLQSNPTDSAETPFRYGNDLGAHGIDYDQGTTPPTTLFWITKFGKFMPNPSVVRANTPTIMIGRRTANTNKICADQMGLMIVTTLPSSAVYQTGQILNEEH